MKGLSKAFARSRISVRLLALLLVPVIGLTFFAVSSALGHRAQANAAADLVDRADRIALLSTLSSAIDDEIEASLTIAGAERVGVGFDGIETEFRRNLQDGRVDLLERTDGALAAVEADGGAWSDPAAVERTVANYDAIEVLRRSETATRAETLLVERNIAVPIRAALNREIDVFETLQGELKLGPELASVVDATESSVGLLNAARIERRALTEHLLAGADSSSSTRDELVEAAFRFEAATDELEQNLPIELRPTFDALVDSRSWEAMETIRTQALSGGVGEVDDRANVLGFAVYVQGFQRTADLTAIDRAITDQVAFEATELAEGSTLRFTLAIGLSVGLALLTAIAGALTVRSIVSPLRRLERRAQRITTGDFSFADDLAGSIPRDLVLVDQAFDDLTEGLQTVNAQTLALSEGRLDDSAFDRAVAGPLGESIDGSVRRIRSLNASLEHQATHDRLTGLPNRSALIALLDDCITGENENRTPLVAIMIDLDGFKHANDTMGHPAGDEVLVQMANRLRELEPEAFLCRLGGDEFMAIMVGEDDEQVGAQLAAQVIEMLSAPIAVSAGTVWISASAGIVASSTPAWLTPTEVMRRADLALYEAKDLGPGQLVVFDQRLHDSVLLQNQIEGELRMALTRDELDLHVQPIMEADGHTLAGFEGLLRWEPEGRPAVPPTIFIPAAERSDLILQIDEWVIDRGCSMLASWDEDPRLAGCSLSLNISGRHVASRDLLRRVSAAVRRHEVDPNRLIIEVTESNLIPNIDRADEVLRDLRALGVKLAIDDFGTGYASVAHLRRVEFDRIKIDRTFVSRLDDVTERSIASLLVSLGRDLDLEVVAEGIETREQLEWAAAAGCTHGQGYFFARPATMANMEEILEAVQLVSANPS